MVDTRRDLPEGGIRHPVPEGEINAFKGRKEPIPMPASDEAVDNLHILKKWLGGTLPPAVYHHVVESGMLEPAETRYPMQEVAPPGGRAAWEGRMPVTEGPRPPDTLIYEAKGYPGGYLEPASMEIPNPVIEEGLSRLGRFIQGLLPDLFPPSAPRGVPSRPSPQGEPLPVPEGAQAEQPAPTGNGGLRDMRVRTPDTHLAPGEDERLRERDFWLTPEAREHTRAARQTLMQVDRTPPAGPFAETDNATLQALAQSLEGSLRDEVLKELDLRAGQRTE